jgi:hypothetical protein
MPNEITAVLRVTEAPDGALFYVTVYPTTKDELKKALRERAAGSLSEIGWRAHSSGFSGRGNCDGGSSEPLSRGL